MGYKKVAIPKQSDEEETTTALLFSQDHQNINNNRSSYTTITQQNPLSPSSSSQGANSSSSSSSSSLMTSYDPENGSHPPTNGSASVNIDNSNHHQQQQQQTVVIPETAHQISTDSWLQCGFVLTTGINSAYVLGYSGAIMVPLGWIPAVLGLLAATGISLYANSLVAKLHEYGGKRHIRYRDLAGFIYGPKAYSLTWALQYINLFMINTGFIILAGSSIKATYVLFRDDDVLKLPYCIIISGFVCALFAIGIPHLSALRIWLGVSTFFGLIYIIIAIALSLKDGNA
ncbi:hypothetical protein SOVF_197590 isoform A [Spinacia oleracea]|nr:hypothetical protein SOVF_197590 isoform A [Spinacia oleracea]